MSRNFTEGEESEEGKYVFCVKKGKRLKNILTKSDHSNIVTIVNVSTPQNRVLIKTKRR
jgi:hypothetical protein